MELSCRFTCRKKDLLFCWLMLQGSTTGTWTGAKQVEETLHAYAWSCGVPSIMPDGDLESKDNMHLSLSHSFLHSLQILKMENTTFLIYRENLELKMCYFLKNMHDTSFWLLRLYNVSNCGHIWFYLIIPSALWRKYDSHFKEKGKQKLIEMLTFTQLLSVRNKIQTPFLTNLRKHHSHNQIINVCVV